MPTPQFVTRFPPVASTRIEGWGDIHRVLDGLAGADARAGPEPGRGGVAFVTFEFGIDGVTIEIAKYATCFENLFRERGIEPRIHCIGGDFHASADQVLADRWSRERIPGANGWSKWLDGEWYKRLFAEEMPSGSAASKEAAAGIWRQAVEYARHLGNYVCEHGIDLLVPVNVNSNPGNPAFALAVVLVSETGGIPVLNSCHDFFWESGKPASAREPGEAPGARDHFFHNHENAGFFAFLGRVHPWSGKRWEHFVINALQRETLVERHDVPRARVREVGTFIEDDFFVPVTPERRVELRRHLGYILGHGERMIPVERVDRFEESVDSWMREQVPLVCGAESGLAFDIADSHAIWFLQPTRIVTRKRIPRDWELIGTLFGYTPFRRMFEENPDLTLTLHVTGPVPVEHARDLRDLVASYQRVLKALPPFLKRRVFLALSAGKLGHSAFHGRGLDHLNIADLYHLADLVLLPSATEGRGLPILEAAAAGLPTVCSRYRPREVYDALVGRSLRKRKRIRALRFPEKRFRTSLLQEITDLVFLPDAYAATRLHNRRAVAGRFSMREVTLTIAQALDRLAGGPAGNDEGNGNDEDNGRSGYDAEEQES